MIKIMKKGAIICGELDVCKVQIMLALCLFHPTMTNDLA